MINKVEVTITMLSQGKVTTIINHRNSLVKILMN